MLHGAFTPPYCPALAAQRLGSISLCGGARSNCAQPQNMSRGKNMRSLASAACQLICEGESCALVKTEISTGTATTQINFFIKPPACKDGHLESTRLRRHLPPVQPARDARRCRATERNIVPDRSTAPYWTMAMSLKFRTDLGLD